MANISYTTLAAAAAVGDQRVQLTSGSALVVARKILVNDEILDIRDVPGASVYAKVFRGHLGTKARAHSSGDRAWIFGANQVSNSRPQGIASTTAYGDLPRIVLPDSNLGIDVPEVWVPFGTEWLKVSDSGFAGRVRTKRQRFTIAEVNAGAEFLPAIYGYGYKLVSAKAISVGGAASAVTTVDLLATLSASSRKLVAWAQASLTQSTVLADGADGAAVLADGASYTVNDQNTAITIGKTGSSVATATHIDVIANYVIEPN